MKEKPWVWFSTLMTSISILLVSLFYFPNLPITVTAIAVIIFSGLNLTRQLVAAKQNIHELKHHNRVTTIKLEEYQTRFNMIFDSAYFGIALINLDGSFNKTNPAFCELFNYYEKELLGLKIFQLMHAGDVGNIQAFMQQLIENKIPSYQLELQCCQKGGETIWVIMTINLLRNSHAKPTYYMVQMQNISLQKKAEEKLRHMAYHDPLTGLANRNKLEQFINHILASSRRHQQTFGLLFLDLDRFKNINDTIGHEAGDALLQIIAERLRSSVRTTDLVARLGGDEFVLVITDVKRTEAVALIAQKILDTVLQAIIIKGQELYITTSVGISLYPYDGQNMQTLMKNADLALYRAKDHGRNNYQFFTIEMTGKAQERMALQNALAHALAKDEFILQYQPIMSIDTRGITTVEALLRWQNIEYGMITPDEIISLAEETGLIVPVSDWILETACKQLKTWHNAGYTSLRIAVNCSPRQFKQSNFTDDVLKVVTRVGLPASSLEIEVTEKLIMEDPENTLRVLYALKDIGVKIIIDDFGTGYWSLNNMRRLSVDKIKIDKSFIKQLTVDETSAAIVSAILAMSKKLGITSVAEGVETQEQYELLVHEGCDEIQGYYLSQPLPAADMTQFINKPVAAFGKVENKELETR